MTGRPEDTQAPPPSRSRHAVFLERHSYRRRRLLDVARLLPLLGVMLLLVPLLWIDADEAALTGGAALPMSRAITYVFGVWAALILGAVLFGLGARRWGDEDRPTLPDRD